MKKENQEKIDKFIKTIESFNVVGQEKEDALYLEYYYNSLMELDDESLKKDTAYAVDEERAERAYCNDVSKEYHCLLKQKNPFGLRIDAEDTKHMILSKGEPSPWKFPDLIVHGGRNNTEKQKQMVVCEAKRFSILSSQNFLDDLNKLLEFSGNIIWKGNGFKYAVFLLIGGSSDKLSERIKTVFSNQECELENLYDCSKQTVRFLDFLNAHRDDLSKIIVFVHRAVKDVEMLLLGDII